MSSFAEAEPVSGLAGDIRASITSDQHDLGGYTEIRARDLILSAFSKPLTAPTEMVKFTFVVGGGKLVRSRYSEDLTKWMVAALREIGYTEDRSAAETFDSQGTFKQQHDTGQNLKYLIVYPRVACASAVSKEKADGAEAGPDPSSPSYLLAACQLETFKAMLAAKVSSYAQKKAALKVLQESQEVFRKIEEKLVSGAQLSAQEQAQYDSNCGCDEEKITWLQSSIKEMVDKGELTVKEKQELLQQMEGNLPAVEAELAEAREEKKMKKIEKLEAKKAAMLTRKEHVKGIVGQEPRLQYGAEIAALYLRLFPLKVLEEKERSMSLTLQDLKLLEEKSDIEQQIKELEINSRGWFVTDEDFQLACEAEEKRAKNKFKTQKAAPKGHSSASAASKPKASAPSASAWSTVGGVKKLSGAKVGSAAGAKKSSSSFAAAFGGEDSD